MLDTLIWVRTTEKAQRNQDSFISKAVAMQQSEQEIGHSEWGGLLSKGTSSFGEMV